ncbi:MAG TPA: hypothetical protein VI837_04615 [Blastocatellia bacterium]|nr:hypothetical protein [Blastocatellia bacterium]
MNTSKPQAREGWLLAVGVLLALSAVACTVPSRSGSQATEHSAANRTADPAIEVSPEDAAADSDDPCSVMFSNLFVAVDSISYNEYEVIRLHKIIHDKEYGGDIPVTYAVLKSGGRTIATFDGVYFGLGNQTDFGFASLLGGETKQLIVSQTVRRGGRHWIVDISSDGAILFDSNGWAGGNEEVCIHDLDGDGVEEISLAITSFWGFDAMSMAESPMTGVVFRYDSKARKYMPDKSAFARGLTHIDEDVQAIDPSESPRDGLKGPYLAVRLDIFLRYVYAGRENDGWLFFDKAYNLTDKQEMKREIKRILNAEPVYRFVYGIQPLKRRAT